MSNKGGVIGFQIPPLSVVILVYLKLCKFSVI